MPQKRNATILEEKIENEEKIVRMVIDGTSITIRRPLVANEEDVRRLYDTCNRVFKEYPECFYTPEQTKEKNKLLSMENK